MPQFYDLWSVLTHEGDSGSEQGYSMAHVDGTDPSPIYLLLSGQDNYVALDRKMGPESIFSISSSGNGVF